MMIYGTTGQFIPAELKNPSRIFNLFMTSHLLNLHNRSGSIPNSYPVRPPGKDYYGDRLALLEFPEVV